MKTLKQTGARGVMRISKTNVQVIIGTSVEFLAEAIKERLKKAIQHRRCRTSISSACHGRNGEE